MNYPKKHGHLCLPQGSFPERGCARNPSRSSAPSPGDSPVPPLRGNSHNSSGSACSFQKKPQICSAWTEAFWAGSGQEQSRGLAALRGTKLFSWRREKHGSLPEGLCSGGLSNAWLKNQIIGTGLKAAIKFVNLNINDAPSFVSRESVCNWDIGIFLAVLINTRFKYLSWLRKEAGFHFPEERWEAA